MPRGTRRRNTKVNNVFRRLQVRLTMLAVDESGMSTVEYAMV
jgi:hypothetical protein